MEESATNFVILISILASIHPASGQEHQAQTVMLVLEATTAASQATTQTTDTTVPPKGNLSCNYYSFDLTMKMFNKTDDVEEFLGKNGKALCNWRRNNGNMETEARSLSEFKRVEIKNSTIARIPSKFFANFSKLVIFRARSVQLQEIKACDFEATDNLQLIDLSRNEISKLENLQFSNLRSIKEIDLSNNKISAIDDGAFDQMGSNLTRVDLSGNKIKTFKEDFFLKMIANVSRKWLPFDIVLRNNEIESIEPSQRDAVVLPEVNLELSGNRMKVLELLKIEIFEIKLNNHSLESINVNASFINADNNQLTKLRIKGKTRSLSARNNQISEVTYDDHLSMLRTFAISSNKLSAETVFNISQKIINVESFDISSNPLGSLKVDTFSELVRLERLALSNTGLSEIPFGVFAYQKSLKVLDISYNNISDVDLHVFSAMPILETLDLSGTNFSLALACNSTRKILPRLRSIGIENSSWKCKGLSTLKLCLNSKGIVVMDPVFPVKNESSVGGLKCTSDAEIAKNSTTTTTMATAEPTTTHGVHEKLSEMMGKVDRLSERVHSGDEHRAQGISPLELCLSIFLAIIATAMVIYAGLIVRNYYKRNRFHMPFSGRNSPDTVITYEGTIGR